MPAFKKGRHFGLWSVEVKQKIERSKNTQCSILDVIGWLIELIARFYMYIALVI